MINTIINISVIIIFISFMVWALIRNNKYLKLVKKIERTSAEKLNVMAKKQLDMSNKIKQILKKDKHFNFSKLDTAYKEASNEED